MTLARKRPAVSPLLYRYLDHNFLQYIQTNCAVHFCVVTQLICDCQWGLKTCTGRFTSCDQVTQIQSAGILPGTHLGNVLGSNPKGDTKCCLTGLCNPYFEGMKQGQSKDALRCVQTTEPHRHEDDLRLVLTRRTQHMMICELI